MEVTDTEIATLTEKQLKEIEARLGKVYAHWHSPQYVKQLLDVDMPAQTAINELTRNTRETEQCAECAEDGFRADMFKCCDCEQWFHRFCLRDRHVEAETAALRDQLAQLERERNEAVTRADDLSRQLLGEIERNKKA